ncbi:hypothetical protein J6590_043190 [Homalodisca vitripennis]|nr:hypothetical protein J6590_043190 [Homalodisca vitripennis]
MGHWPVGGSYQKESGGELIKYKVDGTDKKSKVHRRDSNLRFLSDSDSKSNVLDRSAIGTPNFRRIFRRSVVTSYYYYTYSPTFCNNEDVTCYTKTASRSTGRQPVHNYRLPAPRRAESSKCRTKLINCSPSRADNLSLYIASNQLPIITGWSLDRFILV